MTTTESIRRCRRSGIRIETMAEAVRNASRYNEAEVLINGDRYGVYGSREQAERIAAGLRQVWWASKPTIETRAV